MLAARWTYALNTFIYLKLLRCIVSDSFIDVYEIFTIVTN